MKKYGFYIGLAVLVIVCMTQISTAIVVGSSMYPTYNDGDFCILLKHAEIKHGDVVAIYSDRLSKLIYKRVMGVGGDTVEVNSNSVVVNGVPVDEPYIVEEWTSAPNVTIIPEGSVYVLGDNRNVSGDSRVLGCLKEDDIIGVSVWNITKMTGLHRNDLVAIVAVVWLLSIVFGCFSKNLFGRRKNGDIDRSSTEH